MSTTGGQDTTPVPAGALARLESRPLYRDAVRIVRELRDAGHTAYVCGGSVRDLLTGQTPKDFDIVTSAVPDAVEELFPRTVAVGKQFGVIRVMVNDEQFEVATFRSDAEYADGRRPVAVRFAGVAEDAARRDFTINGMFLDPLSGTILDLIGGRADIEAGVIRTIGDPAERFGEDHLRLMRAIRFACQLGFDIDPPTWLAICERAEQLALISAERITVELTRILCEGAASRGVGLLSDSGLLAVMLPEVAAIGADGLRRARLGLERLGCPSVELALAVLFFEVPDAAAERALGRLRLSSRGQKRVLLLLSDRNGLVELDDAPVAHRKRLLRSEHAEELLEMWRVRALATDGRLDRYHEHRLALHRWRQERSLFPDRLLDGEALMALGVAPGPRIGELLEELEDEQLEGRITDDRAAHAWISERVTG